MQFCAANWKKKRNKKLKMVHNQQKKTFRRDKIETNYNFPFFSFQMGLGEVLFFSKFIISKKVELKI